MKSLTNLIKQKEEIEQQIQEWKSPISDKVIQGLKDGYRCVSEAEVVIPITVSGQMGVTIEVSEDEGGQIFADDMDSWAVDGDNSFVDMAQEQIEKSPEYKKEAEKAINNYKDFTKKVKKIAEANGIPYEDLMGLVKDQI